MRAGAGSWRPIPHTADTGIAAEAATFRELVEVLAAGMFSLMFDVDGLHPATTTSITVSAEDHADNVVLLLSELLAWSEVEQLVPCTFAARRSGADTVLEVGAAPLPQADIVGPVIKAVTYHGLTVEATDSGWEAQVIFDV